MNRPALLIAGTHSGCGKTTVALGLMAAMRQRGFVVQPFKCGPDFIDPTLHLLTTGRASRNLDICMCGADYVRQLFAVHAPTAANGPALSVVEGAMGLFDGGSNSAAAVAMLLDLPVLLVVDVRSMAESAAAVVKGFETMEPRIRVAGVLLNQTGSDRHLRMVSDAVRQHCQAEILGALPREAGLTLPSRHLGLHMGPEVSLNQQRLIRMMEQHADVDRLVGLAGKAAAWEAAPLASPAEPPLARVRLGLAWDEAFCFYYQDNVDLLSAAGADIVLFSPLRDRSLPEGLDGLYLGGGYPELHAAQLAANQGMREQVLAFARSGRPVYGECGGFMYLTEALFDGEGRRHPMVGVYPTVARMGCRLRRLGLRRAAMQADSLLGPAGSFCHGHEFHYSDIDPMPSHVQQAYLLDDGRTEGYMVDGVLASYVHMHWGRTPEAARRLIRLMNPSTRS